MYKRSKGLTTKRLYMVQLMKKIDKVNEMRELQLLVEHKG